jgi:isopenicillin-N N-acyltransferase like protein
MRMSYPHVRVSGTAVERGRSYGEQAREAVHRSLAAYERVFAHYAGLEWADVRAQAARFAEPIGSACPRAMDEITGIAQGAGVEVEDVLALNVRTETMFAAKARHASETIAIECTAFVALPDATADGHVLAGQNWDWLLHSYETVVVLECEPVEGPAFVTVVEAGLLAKTGMNAAGLGLVTNSLVSDADLGEPGVPYHVALRACLDSSAIEEAVETLHRFPRAASANYLLADDKGRAADVEVDAGRAALVTWVSSGVFVHANHFCAADFQGHDVGLALVPDSLIRQMRLGDLLDEGRSPISIEELQQALSDHANYPGSVCAHSSPDLPVSERTATAASVIWDLTARRLWLADGNPCTSPYRDVDYSGFLARLR